MPRTHETIAKVLLAVSLAAPQLAYAQDCRILPTSRSQAMTTKIPAEPLACMLGAMTAQQRTRHDALATHLRLTVKHVRELPDGYAFEYAFDPAVFVAAAEFITLEHRCCPFYHFRLEQDPNDGPIRLFVTGPPDAKAFIKPVLAR